MALFYIKWHILNIIKMPYFFDLTTVLFHKLKSVHQFFDKLTLWNRVFLLKYLHLSLELCRQRTGRVWTVQTPHQGSMLGHSPACKPKATTSGCLLPSSFCELKWTYLCGGNYFWANSLGWCWAKNVYGIHFDRI